MSATYEVDGCNQLGIVFIIHAGVVGYNVQLAESLHGVCERSLVLLIVAKIGDKVAHNGRRKFQPELVSGDLKLFLNNID